MCISVYWFFCCLWVRFSCFFVFLIIFDWVPDIVNFTLLGAGWIYVCMYVSMCISILELWCGTQLPYWEIAWSFLALLVGGTRVVFSTNFVPLSRWIPSKCSMPFSLPDWLATGTPQGLPRGLFSAGLSCFLPHPQIVSLHTGPNVTLLSPGTRSPLSCAAVSFSLLLPENISPLASLGSRLHSSLPKEPRTACIPLPALRPGNVLAAVSWAVGVPLVFFCFLIFSVMKIVTYCIHFSKRGKSKCSLCDRNEHWNSRI